ncbi:MAG TPA: class I SAM-dependent methyltransferase [Candidatus Limnocylindria bacterium]|nr:class I SAM-dependent methyltransferase [Candidatus Limnocylindria bacterium]
MKLLDRALQRRRIAVAASWIPRESRVLDVGCADGALFELLRDRVAGGVGIDPQATPAAARGGVRLLRGMFPADAPDERFDAITMLAVLEHLPASSHAATGEAAARLLRPGGRLVITVPEPAVDRIVDVLTRFGLADGMSLAEHHGFQTQDTPGIFEPHGFRLLTHRRFQLGLNNLFVFERRGDVA